MIWWVLGAWVVASVIAAPIVGKMIKSADRMARPEHWR